MAQVKREASPATGDSMGSKRENISRDPTLPILGTIEKVRGYGTLTIYKMQKSPYFYVRLFEDKKIIRKSTKKTERKDALRFAEEFFVQIKTKKLNQQPLSGRSGFEVCALGLLEENRGRASRGEVAEKKCYQDKLRLEADLLPFFRKYEVADIDYRLIMAYVNNLNSDENERRLSGSSLKIHLSHLKTVLKYAQRMGVIQALPIFPTIKAPDRPRAWFNKAEYSKLHNTARTHTGESFKISLGTEKTASVRHGVLTEELYDLILFMTNTFIRPTDIRVLRHKHIEIVKSQQVYLRLSHPMTKKHASPIVSLPAAIDVYKRIVKRQKKEGFGGDDDFVFQPQHAENRDYAIQQIHRQFDHLLKITDLKTDPSGEPRTLYSLRHTAIMFRLIESDGLDLLSLARNARTSVEMIDRFYAKHLTAEMNVDLIQSNRTQSLRDANDAISTRVKKTPDDAKRSSAPIKTAKTARKT
jgi:hypothetical protein